MLRRATQAAFRQGNAAFGAAITPVRPKSDLIAKVTEEISNHPGGKMFDSAVAKAGVEEFVHMGFDKSYISAFDAATIAEHVTGFLAARAKCIDCELQFGQELEKHAYWFCADSPTAQRRALRELESYVEERQELMSTHAVSVRSYTASGVMLFTVDFHEFINPHPAAGAPLKELTTREFLERRATSAHERYSDALKQVETAIKPVAGIHEVGDGVLALNIALRPDRSSYLDLITSVVSHCAPGSQVVKKFAETFSNGIQVYSFYISGATKEQLRNVGSLVGLLPNRPKHALAQLFAESKITSKELMYGYSVIAFAYYYTLPSPDDNFAELARHVKKDAVLLKRLTGLRNNLFQEMLSEGNIASMLATNVDLFHEMYAEFDKGSTAESSAALREKIADRFRRQPAERSLFETLVTFNQSVRATNFYAADKAAIAYRLDPAFLKQLDYARVPYGIYMIIGATFRGFHIRFHDVCRGGVRMLLPIDETDYRQKKKTLFQENYNLAYTQMLKNKDIPESGSKGTLLVSTRWKGKHRDPQQMQALFLQYCSSLLDIMLQEPGVRFNLPNKEILFLGPDENTAGDMPSAAAHYAKSRGYSLWKTLTTGKQPTDGGIPHDTYGMTTRSVRQCVLGIYEKFGLDQTKLTKFQTGGPDGDLGSNEILLGQERLLGICDLAGSLYDPNGLDRDEMLRLAKARARLDQFDLSKLSKGGFFVPYADDINVSLPDGTVVTDGKLFLSEYHLSKWASADTFVPCGGRPNAVTLDKVQHFVVNAPGVTGEQLLEGSVKVAPVQLKFKYIVEGANLFITHDARLALENAGVQLIKDSTANKGGVTSSSLEIYSGLALSDAEHAELMCGELGNLPDFYQKLVIEIVQRVEARARAEFLAVWDGAKAGYCDGKHTLVADELSGRVVQFVEFIAESNLHENEALFNYVLDKYTPETLKKQVPLEIILERVPETYLRAIFQKALACDYVYSCGIKANEFSFFEFMHALERKAQEAAKQ